MINLNIMAVKGSDNETLLAVVDSNGVSFDLDINGVTEVRIEVCGRLYNAMIQNVAFSGNVITAVFGDLDLPPGRYKPKIIYFSPSKPEGEVIAAECFETQISLKMVC